VLKPPTTTYPLDQPAAFQKALIDWFRLEGKSYPWRETEDPYAIHISEVMLQQTTIAAVLGKGFYTRFLTTFPDIVTLAKAEEQNVLAAWEGLGYYSRARNLQKTAKAIIADHNGVFPKEHANIIQLPGIGPYTAGAISSFAYNDSYPIVDGNVARVFSRLFDFHEPIDKPKALKQLWDWAAELVSPDQPRLYNSALMELGQTHCSKAQPECFECPVSHFCQTSIAEELPKKTPRKKMTEITEHVIFCQKKNGDVLLQQETGKRRTGLWKLPARDTLTGKPILTQHYVITRYKVTLHIHSETKVQPQENESYIPLAELEKTPMPAPFRKSLRALLDK